MGGAGQRQKRIGNDLEQAAGLEHLGKAEGEFFYLNRL
jgi:hypothetical protein